MSTIFSRNTRVGINRNVAHSHIDHFVAFFFLIKPQHARTNPNTLPGKAIVSRCPQIHGNNIRVRRETICAKRNNTLTVCAFFVIPGIAVSITSHLIGALGRPCADDGYDRVLLSAHHIERLSLHQGLAMRCCITKRMPHRQHDTTRPDQSQCKCSLPSPLL